MAKLLFSGILRGAFWGKETFLVFYIVSRNVKGKQHFFLRMW